MTIERIPVADLEGYCAAYGPELVEAIRLQFPPVDGAHQIPLDQWYRLARAARRKLPAPRRGLGDLVGAVATPIARALRLPCIDPATQQLRPESGCAKRKADWNRKGEAVKAALNRLTQ